MPETSDPIIDTPSAKRRKLDAGDVHNQPKRWNSDDDSGDDLNDNDFATAATIPTQPLAGQKRPHLQSSYITQPTQTLPATQPTQPLHTAPDVQVGRSSPISSDATAAPTVSSPPLKRPGARAWSRPNGILASAMAPPGTTFRPPLGIPPPPASASVDVDSDEDPPVHHSSDDESTQALRSNLKPTSFTKGGRNLDSTSSPHRIQESPRATTTSGVAPVPTFFTNMMSSLAYKPNQPPLNRAGSATDMASAYGSTSRAPRPSSSAASRPPPRPTESSLPPGAVIYKSLAEIHDAQLLVKIKQIQAVLPNFSVEEISRALARKRNNVSDTMADLAEQEDAALGGADELTLSPVQPAVRKGVAQSVVPGSSSQPPLRPFHKQLVKGPSESIAKRYGRKEVPAPAAPQNIVEVSDDDEEGDVKPKGRRLVQGRRPGSKESSPPPSSPAAAAPTVSRLQKTKKNKAAIVIDSDDEPAAESSDAPDSDDEQGEAEEEGSMESDHDAKLLEFLNTASVRDLAELSAQPEETLLTVVAQRPFASLDQVRTITLTGTTKTGKASRARPIGDKLVDDCSEMLIGYDAIDELVRRCEELAAPVQAALQSWGVMRGGAGANGAGAAAAVDGELQLMSLEEAHDSGIGTPSSTSPAADRPSDASAGKKKRSFVGQPPNMNPEFTLKDYQLVGLNWLNLLFKQETSCILADDMGLGKTCQVIAFLAYLQTQKVDGVHLIIVPGSTLENWLREFERFAPALSVRPYYGSQAEREEVRYSLEEDFDTLDVIVTTYDMAVGAEDNKFLRRLGPFSVCVYDEAHALRNPKSQRYQQLVRIGADFKVLLTGTPLQNNLQELIAILAFIMPDLFQEKRAELEYIFKHKASTKDTDSAALFSRERIGRARTMMTPFILRRKKHQVLDLPAKHCRVEYCDMTPTQAAHYADVLDEAQEVYAQKLTGGAPAAGRGTAAASKAASSNVMMKLRKAAIHPLLSLRIFDARRIDRLVAALQKTDEFGSNPPDKIRAYLTGDAPISLKGGDFGLHRFCAARPALQKFALRHEEWMDAGKVARFADLVSGYAARGDRVLVFSQFTTAMDILEQVLETLALRFVRLDGSTKMDHRQELIDAFSADPDIAVFLLSTRAGGAGLNLAAANRVIIFDSGFNPQDDVQAENRAHRVGQTRDVEVVRLVTRGTIEEQIHALGEAKLALDDRVAGAAAAGNSAAGEDKAREKAGEMMVEKMLLEKLQEEGRKEKVVEKEKPKPKLKLKAGRHRPDEEDEKDDEESDDSLSELDDAEVEELEPVEESTKSKRKTSQKKSSQNKSETKSKGKGKSSESKSSTAAPKKKKSAPGMDLRDAFKAGLEKQGVRVQSKQAVL